MSSDNGVYIGVFPLPCICLDEDGKTLCGKVFEPAENPNNKTGQDREITCPICNGTLLRKEYRVIEAQAIENCDYHFSDPDHNDPSWYAVPPRQPSEETKRLQDCSRAIYYGDATTFSNEPQAWEEANRIYGELIEGVGICEYGICIIDYDRPLLDITKKDAQAELDAWSEQEKIKRETKEAEREANTKEYYVLVPVKVREYEGKVNHCGLSADTIMEYRNSFGHVPTKEQADLAIERLKQLWDKHLAKRE